MATSQYLRNSLTTTKNNDVPLDLRSSLQMGWSYTLFWRSSSITSIALSRSLSTLNLKSSLFQWPQFQFSFTYPETSRWSIWGHFCIQQHLLVYFNKFFYLYHTNSPNSLLISNASLYASQNPNWKDTQAWFLCRKYHAVKCMHLYFRLPSMQANNTVNLRQTALQFHNHPLYKIVSDTSTYGLLCV